MKFNQLWLLLFLPAIVCGQTRSVMVNADGEIVAPPNVQILEAVKSIGGPYLLEYVATSETVIPRGVPEITNDVTNIDRIERTITYDNLITDYQLFLDVVRDELGQGVTYASSDTDVATVDSSGFVTHVADGEANITVSVGDFDRVLPLDFSTTFEGSTTFVLGGIDGSLRKALSNPIDTALATSTEKAMFSTIAHSTETYTRNTNFYGYAATGDSDPWTGIPMWTSYATTDNNQMRSGTLVAADVVIFAWHFPLAVGAQLKYLGTDDMVYTRTISARRRVGTTDLGVGLLDTALPVEVEPLKVFPQDVTQYFGVNLGELPAIGVNKWMQGSVRDQNPNYNPFWFRAPLLPNRLATFINMVSGDSGSPAVMTDGTNLILIGPWYSNNGPTSVYRYIPAINAAIEDMGSASTLSELDLSAYPNYQSPPTP